MTQERIMTLHPQGKKGVNISKLKYDQVKDYILKTLSTREKITYQELDKLAVTDMRDYFDGKVTWYVVSVKLDLEARKIIERIPKTSPHEIRLCK